MASAKATALGSGVPRGGSAARAGSKGGLLLGLGAVLLAAAGAFFLQRTRAKPWTMGYRVVKAYPHDPQAYTQGLLFDGGLLHESTGQRGFSSVRTVELETGRVLRSTELGRQYFGEGLARVGDRLIQLTWQEGVARVYDRTTLKPLDQFEYEGEGWGLAFDGTQLVMSDGSETLTYRDPATFKELRRVRVMVKGTPLRALNELEMVEGELWANVWKQDYLARIEPRSGEVLGFVDLAGIFDRRSIANEDAVLNGIAYDPDSRRLFVTGKLWPKVFEIEVVAK